MGGADAPKVRIFPPLVYLAGLAIGHLANRWLPVDAVPVHGAWIVGGILRFGIAYTDYKAKVRRWL
jgi:hypothetical protein